MINFRPTLLVMTLFAMSSLFPCEAATPYASMLDPNNMDMTPGDRNTGATMYFPPAALIQNGGRVLDVKNPPAGFTPLKGDGITDDTEALKNIMNYLRDQFMKMGWAMDKMVYFPAGTYLVSDTIWYRGPMIAADKLGGPGETTATRNWDLCIVRFIGESRETVTIKLKDNAPGFDNPASPKPVVTYYHPDTPFNNAVGRNMLLNMTINTGKNNPGAIGVSMISANRSEISNVKITSGDGKGVAGFSISRSCAHGWEHDITIEGFDYGIRTSVDNLKTQVVHSVGFEHITLRNQNKAAIETKVGTNSFRLVRSEQTKPGVYGAVVDSDSPQTLIIDSLFSSVDTSIPAIKATQNEKQHLFVRNVSAKGYGAAVEQQGIIRVPGLFVEEYNSYPAERSMNFPVENMPILNLGKYPLSDWANVNEFGAKGDGVTDDSAAIQAAYNSGKSVIYFPKNLYRQSSPVTIPASVKVIYGMGAEIMGTQNITEDSSDVLYIYAIGLSSFTRKSPTIVNLYAKRNLAFNYYSGQYYNLQDKPVKVYMSNCNGIGKNAYFCPNNQITWARGINTESNSGNDFHVYGGVLWVFQFKTEHMDYARAFHVKDNGILEVLGGIINCPTMQFPKGQPAMLVENANISFIGVTNQKDYFEEFIKIIDGEKEMSLYKDQFPPRGGRNSVNSIIPMISHYKDENLPFPVRRSARYQKW